MAPDTTIPLDSHGFVVARAPAATPTVFTDIAQMGDVTPPALMHEKFKANVQGRGADYYVVSHVMNRDPLQFELHFIDTNGTHDHLTGVLKAFADVTLDGWRMTSTYGGNVYQMSGQVTKFAQKEPVEGKQVADVEVTMSGPWLLNGVVMGL